MASIRAAQLQHSLRAIEAIAGGAHERVLARMRPATLTQIRTAGTFDWLPVELDLELVAAVEAELGPGSDRRRARVSVLEAMRSPLLGPFVRGVQTIFALEPAGLLRQAPRAWHAVYREVGVLSYGVGGGAERFLVFTELPAQVVGNAVYLEAIAGAFEAIYDLCKVEGRVEVANVDVAGGRAELQFSWY